MNLVNMKTALVLMIKNENNYIKEYIEYYKNLGIDCIFLCDNNDINGESPLSIIHDDYITSGFIKYIDIRGKSAFQLENYTNIYNTIKSDFNWIAFFDADEFLYLGSNFTNIKDWLNQQKFNNCNQILINWVNYGDNDIVDVNGNYKVLERFKLSCSELGLYPTTHPKCIDVLLTCVDYTVKSILRGNLENIHFTSAHYVDIENTVNVNGDNIICGAFQLPCSNDIFIKHFATKTIQEFLDRCDSDVKYNNSINLINAKLLAFFSKSKYTNQKYKLIQNKYPWFSYRPDLSNSQIDIIITYTNENKKYINDSIKSINTNMPWINNIFIIYDNSEINIEQINISYKNVIIVDYLQFIPYEFTKKITRNLVDLFIWNIKGLSERFIYFDDMCFIKFPCFEDEFFNGCKLNISRSTMEKIPHQYRSFSYNATSVLMELFNISAYDFSEKQFYIFEPYFIPMLKTDCETCFKILNKILIKKDLVKNIYYTEFNKFIYPTWSFFMRHTYNGPKLTKFHNEIIVFSNDELNIYPQYKIDNYK